MAANTTEEVVEEEILQNQKFIFEGNIEEDAQLRAIEEKMPKFFIGRIMQEGESFGEIALQHQTRR